MLIGKILCYNILTCHWLFSEEVVILNCWWNNAFYYKILKVFYSHFNQVYSDHIVTG